MTDEDWTDILPTIPGLYAWKERRAAAPDRLVSLTRLLTVRELAEWDGEYWREVNFRYLDEFGPRRWGGFWLGPIKMPWEK